MLQPKKLKSVPLPFRLASILFLLLPLWWTYTNLLFAPNTPYSVEQLNVSGAVEYRFKFNGHHFMTLIDENGTFILRPHPGCDINGWGSSWYAQPFLPGAVLKHTVIHTATASTQGIQVVVSGNVSRDVSATYGMWGTTLDVKYDPLGRTITGTGEYTIALTGQLSNATGDLNLYFTT
jgi:hypothetical protein